MSLRFALVGHPVAHSRSPALHHAALESAGLLGSFELTDAPDEQAFRAVVDRLRLGTLSGLNVTVPHKLLAARLADTLSATARSVGAVNTLCVNADGALAGHNTDVEGLSEATRMLLGARTPRVAAVIGAGGAARAAVAAARALGVAEVRVTNRTRSRAEALSDRFGGEVLVAGTPRQALQGADLVYQATTLGMGWHVSEPRFQALVASAAQALVGCTAAAVLVDLVYVPRQTPWVRAARERGLIADDGLEMLVRQAAGAFALWTGVRPDLSAMRRAVGAV